MIFHQHGRPGNPCRDCRGGDLCAACAFRHVQEHSPTAEIEIAGPFVKTKNRVRSETRQSQVGKSEFGARICARPHRRAAADIVIHHGRTRRGLRRKQLHIFDDSRDVRFLQFCRDCRSGRSDQQKRNNDQPDKVRSSVTGE